ncbi:Hypothetical predicted protein [Paramuricea clavata]|uniref:Uncharacterized protein n=2 Tax=Paramuricea clavata TaxID=317549 RepID=A0A6S7K593_PARCT|nr:Hypothetical predicted protein [Paramuricea clavata]
MLSRIPYSANGCCGYQLEWQLITSGDVELNPGPDTNTSGNEQSRRVVNHPIMNSSNKSLKIGEWNVNNLTDVKFEQIKLFLTSHNIDVMFLIETFLKPNVSGSVYEIPGYSMYRKDRAGNKKGGGILAYVNSQLKANRLYDLEDENVEIMWLSICPYSSNRALLAGAVYRPPSSNADTDIKLENNIENAYLKNYEMHILVLDIGLSDHLPLIIQRKYSKAKRSSKQLHNTIKYRNFKNLNADEFVKSLECTAWDSAFVFDDINDIADSIEKMLIEVVDMYMPLNHKRVKKQNQPAWMSDEIMNSIRNRDNLLKKARKSNIPADWALYKHARCKTTNMIKFSKRQFIQESIENNQGNPKGIWKVLKSLSGKKNNPITIDELKVNDAVVKDKAEIAEAMNDAFINIASRISQGNQNNAEFDGEKLVDFVKLKIGKDCFEIPPITSTQVLAALNSMPTNKSTGCDGLSARILKLAAPVLSQPFCRLMNYSISSGTFPIKWKTAKVTPLHKSGSRDDADNYRPISILPVISKVLEKHVATSFYKYLQDHNLLYKFQSGFRANHSTETALINLVDELFFNMDDDKVTCLTFIDFKKAFDLINHKTLLKKLAIYGVDGSSIAWFTSYLSARKQFVKLNECVSTCQVVSQGVPQGSILGPLLFITFINDMPLHMPDPNVEIYADDTTLARSASIDKLPVLTRMINQDLICLERWCNENGMVINTSKTKCCNIHKNN